MKIVSWLALALAALVLILFAVSNRETVSVGLWPLVPATAIELPLYLLVLGTLLVGFVAGELVAWIGGRRWRREARRSRDRIAMLEREVEAARLRGAEERAPVAVIER